jgi:ABC-2 type transport system ATP-binding protein
MAAIRVEGLRKTFGDVRALDGLTLTVEPGTIFGFLGPNGAGKTTTIRILTGLARPSGGRAWVLGMDTGAARREIARHVGYLPEEPAFYSWMTPREFLDHIGRIFGLGAAERGARVEELLDLVGLAGVSGRRVGGFSRGMRQRLALAQTLVNRPEVLFLDEPASALDPAGRRDVLKLITQLRGQCTVFMSTHILADVERVCDTVGIIARGQMVAEARREELLSRYAIPVFEIEGDDGSAARIAAWTDTLRALPWVTAVSTDGVTTRVTVSDVEKAKRELLATTVQAGLVLTRYEMVRPSLEEVFLRLVGEGGKKR